MTGSDFKVGDVVCCDGIMTHIAELRDGCTYVAVGPHRFRRVKDLSAYTLAAEPAAELYRARQALARATSDLERVAWHGFSLTACRRVCEAWLAADAKLQALTAAQETT